MATMCFAMWLQQVDLVTTNRLIMIFIGLIAAAMVVSAVVLAVVAVKAAKAVEHLSATAEDFKSKLLPLIDVVMDVSKSSQAVLKDAAPKVKVITDNLMSASDTLMETSKVARNAVVRFDITIADVNIRTQRQVARVDDMLTATLTATAEAAEAIGKGIRGPAQKIGAMAGQAKQFAEGLLAKIRSTVASR